MIFKSNYSKYKFKCLLTKNPRETSSLEYIIKAIYTVSSFIVLTYVSVVQIIFILMNTCIHPP